MYHAGPRGPNFGSPEPPLLANQNPHELAHVMCEYIALLTLNQICFTDILYLILCIQFVLCLDCQYIRNNKGCIIMLIRLRDSFSTLILNLQSNYTLTNGEDPGEMVHATFHQRVYCLQR